jgi:hypothetical protein
MHNVCCVSAASLVFMSKSVIWKNEADKANANAHSQNPKGPESWPVSPRSRTALTPRRHNN